jgi:hypothetical protein
MKIRQAAVVYIEEIRISVNNHTNADPHLSFTVMFIQVDCHDSVPV